MKILALEFSSPQRSVAVVHAAGVPPPGAAPSAVEVIETGQLPTKAIGMAEEALRQAQLEREQIECLAIGLGPGSYTGIRAAIALSQGWQLARKVKLAGISSADVVAAQAQADSIVGHTAVSSTLNAENFTLPTMRSLPSTGGYLNRCAWPGLTKSRRVSAPARSWSVRK